jgi:hypothetical protein
MKTGRTGKEEFSLSQISNASLSKIPAGELRQIATAPPQEYISK